MTGICGLVGREADDLESKAKNILSLMRNRGSESRTASQSAPDGKKIVIGVCNPTGTQSFTHQAMPLALDGVFFGDEAEHSKPARAGPRRPLPLPWASSCSAPMRGQPIPGKATR